jgi:hypothetical protein
MKTYNLYKRFKDAEIDSAFIINENSSMTSFLFDPANTDYQTFKKDLADGAELQDAEGNVIDGIDYLEELV